MLLTAGLTAGGARARAAAGARCARSSRSPCRRSARRALLLLVGAFEFTPRSGVPTAGILIGGALTATTLTGRRLLESLVGETNEIEARLCLGDDARTALAPAVRRARHDRPDPGRSTRRAASAS